MKKNDPLYLFFSVKIVILMLFTCTPLFAAGHATVQVEENIVRITGSATLPSEESLKIYLDCLGGTPSAVKDVCLHMDIRKVGHDNGYDGTTGCKEWYYEDLHPNTWIAGRIGGGSGSGASFEFEYEFPRSPATGSITIQDDDPGEGNNYYTTSGYTQYTGHGSYYPGFPPGEYVIGFFTWYKGYVITWEYALLDFPSPERLGTFEIPGLSLSHSNWNATGNGDSQIINITADDEDTYDFTISTDWNWLSALPATGTTPGNSTISAQGNYTGSERTAVFSCASDDIWPWSYPEYAEYITVTQGLASHAILSGTYSDVQEFITTDKITTSGNCTVTGSISLTAGNQIVFSPGFRADRNCYLSGRTNSSFVTTEILSKKTNENNPIDTNMKNMLNSSSSENPENQFSAVPETFAISQNYPNPFNPTTTIDYALPESSPVSLKVYNTLGLVVKTLVDEEQDAGYKSILWDGKDDAGNKVPSGIYIYRISAGTFTETNKMILLK